MPLGRPPQQPAPVDPDDLALMRRMDELYTKWPFYGARRMVAALRQDGVMVKRKRVRRLMRVMGLEAIYQKPNTSKRQPDHKGLSVFATRLGD
jgi:putative transposase